MGPPQAEEMMRDAYTMGADDAVILSDRKFAGADVLQHLMHYLRESLRSEI